VGRAAFEASFPASITEPVAETLLGKWSGPLGDEIDKIARLGCLENPLEFRDYGDVSLDRLPAAVLFLGEDKHCISTHLLAETDDIAAPLARVEEQRQCQTGLGPD
jgi:hypothetical protein